MKKVNSTEKPGYVLAEEYARLLEELARIREYADGLDSRLMAEQALRGRLVEEGVASRMTEVKDAAKAELKADVLNGFSERELSLAAREQAALEREGELREFESVLEEREGKLDVRSRELEALNADLDIQRQHLGEERERLGEERDGMIAQAQAFVLAERQAMDKEFEEKAEKVRRDAEVQLASFFLKACETIDAWSKGECSKEDMEKLLEEYHSAADTACESLKDSIRKKLEGSSKRMVKSKHHLDRVVNMVFGKSSEKWMSPECDNIMDNVRDSLELTEEKEQELAQARAVISEYNEKRRVLRILEDMDEEKRAKKDSETRLPPHLPRIELKPEDPTDADFVAHPEQYDKIGTDRKEVLVPLTPNFAVIVHTRNIYRKKGVTEDVIVEAPAFEGPIWKSYASSALLAKIEVDKFRFHIPLYRQEAMFRQHGLDINRSTMLGWHNAICKKLEPLYLLMVAMVMSSDYLAADGSPFPVVDHEKHRTKKHYLIEFRDVVTNMVVFLSSLGGGRGKKVVQGHMDGWHGRAFLCDGCQSYDWIAKMAGVAFCRCNAHCRRRFFEALEENKKMAQSVLAYYQKIYDVEDMINAKGYKGKKIVEVRNELARPLWEVLFCYVSNNIDEVPENSLMFDAFNYFLSHYESLTAYLNVAQ
ncbi:MAG: IS66 family transposase, partial [Candidatus Cryptobacteroides sp.]